MKSNTLGIIGGGQLCMFTCIAAKKIGVKTLVYSTEEDFSAKMFCDNYFFGSLDYSDKFDQFIKSFIVSKLDVIYF